MRRTFVEQLPGLVARRGSITTRAVGWAIGQLRREHATVHGIARQLGTSWKTVWRAVEPELVKLAEDESRFENVTTLGVDEHIWHHTDPRKRGPKELTGMVDLSRDSTGKTRARLLDLVPGRSGKAYASWLAERGEAFRQNVKVAAVDPFAGYKTAIDDKLEDATAVLDAFHVVKLGTAAVDEVRRRVQQDTLGHRGRTGDPLYGIQTILRAGAENLTEKQRTRLAAAIEADPAHDEVFVAWQCAQQLRSAYHQKDLAEGRRIAEKVVDTFHTCPIPEIARLGRTLRRWRAAFLAYFTTERSSNGGTEAGTGSSNCTAASPAASATATTTGSACSSPPADSPHDPHRMSEEPLNPRNHPTVTRSRSCPPPSCRQARTAGDVVVDHGSIEVFGGDGPAVITALVELRVAGTFELSATVDAPTSPSLNCGRRPLRVDATAGVEPATRPGMNRCPGPPGSPRCPRSPKRVGNCCHANPPRRHVHGI